MFGYQKKEEKKRLTSSEDLGLLDGDVIKDGARLEYLDRRSTGVHDGGLDSGVADALDVDRERAVTLLDPLDREGESGGGKGEARNELHDDCL